MARIISIVNQKGGVGKTTTTINLAAWLAELGKRVLIVDIDPQGNASSGLGIDYKNLNKGMYEVLTDENTRITEAIKSHKPNFHVLPSTPDLAGAGVDLVEVSNREFKLEQNIKEVADLYDYILIDNPPSLGLLTINGLVAAREVLIPVQCEYYALEGLSQLLETIDLIRNHLQPELKVLGAIMTMYDTRNKLSSAVFEELHRYFPAKVFRTVIPRNVKLAEAPSHGLPVKDYDPGSVGSNAYKRLAQELILS
ncbi:chromosome partitioning protein ParA [Candidatus Parcubacteria bacterium]|nr:MAG: chromosome partitioning protein ParA [Candidatus Parcubacteria bacterium]